VIRAFALAHATLGCASGSELDDPRLMGPFVLHAPEPCGMAFDPGPELLDVTQSAAERWSKAMGCDARVEAGGFAVTQAPRVFNPTQGGEVCALTEWDRSTITVATAPGIRCEAPALVLILHEMGHALRGASPEGQPVHSDTGLMRPGADWRPSEDTIDEVSLSFVCEQAPCAGFTPEPASWLGGAPRLR
jgi:hypothetical protein